jgi:hypothetical protein
VVQQEYQQAELKAAVCKAAGVEGGDGRAALEKLGSTKEGQAKLRVVMKEVMPKFGNFAEQLLSSGLTALGKRVDVVEKRVDQVGPHRHATPQLFKLMYTCNSFTCLACRLK